MSQTVKTPAEFAANYKVYGDGLASPIAVGNITLYNGRWIVNLAMKTAKSQIKGASISFPEDWGTPRYSKGDHVGVIVENGYAKKIIALQSAISKSAILEVNSEEVGETEGAAAVPATEVVHIMNVIEDENSSTGFVDGDTGAEVPVKEAKKAIAAKKKANEAAMVAAGEPDNDLPF